jgi:hypothetical protein
MYLVLHVDILSSLEEKVLPILSTDHYQTEPKKERTKVRMKLYLDIKSLLNFNLTTFHVDWLRNMSPGVGVGRHQIHPMNLSPVRETNHPNHDDVSKYHPSIVTMAQQIQDMFPDIPNHWILKDLTQTQSIQNTVENILEGRTQTIEHSPADSRSTNKTEKLPLWKSNSPTGTGTDSGELNTNYQLIRTLALRRSKSEANLYSIS